MTLEKWPSVGDVLCVPAVHYPFVTQGTGASLILGRVLPVFANSAGCRVIVFLCLVSNPIVDEAGLESCVGFLTAGADACPLVGETGFWLSGGQSNV